MSEREQVGGSIASKDNSDREKRKRIKRKVGVIKA